MDVPARQVDSSIVEAQRWEGGEVIDRVLQSVSGPEAPVEEVTCDFVAVAGEVWGVGGC